MKGLTPEPDIELEIALRFPGGAMLAADEVALLDSIRAHRSILGASRALGVSYRKCWLTTDALNSIFETPVLKTFPGRRGGGAELTQFGERLIALYRSIERNGRRAAGPAVVELRRALKAPASANVEAREANPARSRSDRSPRS